MPERSLVAVLDRLYQLLFRNRLLIHPRCTNLIRDMQSATWDAKKPEEIDYSMCSWGHFDAEAALLLTLVLLFSFKGDVILARPLTILWIAIPLFIQTMLIFWLGYGLARLLKLHYVDAAPAAMIGASNHFEVAIATSTMLFGLSSGAALATVVGVLIEVPVMLMLVKICLKTTHWFKDAELGVAAEQPTTG